MTKPKGKGKVRAEDIIVGQNMKRMRQELGLSLEKVAAELGVTYQQIKKYEDGENRISAGLLYELSFVFDIEFEEFFKV